LPSARAAPAACSGPRCSLAVAWGRASGKICIGFWRWGVPIPQRTPSAGLQGFLPAAAPRPLLPTIQVPEMTGDYQLLLPAMWVSTLCFLLWRRWKLYQMQVPTRLDSPAHRGDFIIDVLEGMRVHDVPVNERPLVKIPEAMPLREIL